VIVAMLAAIGLFSRINRLVAARAAAPPRQTATA
jgi:hypothetical protein